MSAPVEGADGNTFQGYFTLSSLFSVQYTEGRIFLHKSLLFFVRNAM